MPKAKRLQVWLSVHRTRDGGLTAWQSNTASRSRSAQGEPPDVNVFGNQLRNAFAIFEQDPAIVSSILLRMSMADVHSSATCLLKQSRHTVTHSQFYISPISVRTSPRPHPNLSTTVQAVTRAVYQCVVITHRENVTLMCRRAPGRRRRIMRLKQPRAATRTSKSSPPWVNPGPIRSNLCTGGHACANTISHVSNPFVHLYLSRTWTDLDVSSARHKTVRHPPNRTMFPRVRSCRYLAFADSWPSWECNSARRSNGDQLRGLTGSPKRRRGCCSRDAPTTTASRTAAGAVHLRSRSSAFFPASPGLEVPDPQQYGRDRVHVQVSSR